MKLKFDDNWRAMVTDDLLNTVPGFTGKSVHVAPYANAVEREKFLEDTFGSQKLLWDTPDILRFDPAGQQLVGLEFQLPEESASAEESARLSDQPTSRPGGLRADETRDFPHRSTTVLCRAPGDTALTCLRDLDVLTDPIEARIEIAPDLALVVQHSDVVGWSLTNPVQYLTTGFTEPDPDPPAPATHRLLTECLDLITQPVIFEVEDREAAAVARLRAVDDALRNQRYDRHRADALLSLVANMAEHYVD
ncbi:hypothetical protein [Streptomyces sp. NBC_00059]|uniref:hypothetical protein n=1 Tax=Streptomyces sp. NBC_00059 TaxID=2975635 RepID=UPI0022531733|nr:hypothetical protein [Streptomyces sp. NBC_00059]MCX5416057.1 hypothetical protein [Streptomyces sp. NBC_00059]